MSLNIYLEHPTKSIVKQLTIPVREDGTIKHLTVKEWNERHPDREPVIPRELLTNAFGEAGGHTTNVVYTANITHNLSAMADEAGLYDVVWRPDENDIRTASQLILPLRIGLLRLTSDSEYYKTFNPENGWGDYEGLVHFIVDYLLACITYPKARVLARG